MTVQRELSEELPGRQVTKRRRKIKVCSNCRERKVKCDYLKPSCTNCTKKQLNCFYQPFKNPGSDYEKERLLKTEISKLQAELQNLQAEQNSEDPLPAINANKYQHAIIKTNRITYYGVGSLRSFLHYEGGESYKIIGQFLSSVKAARNDWKFLNKIKQQPYHPLTNVAFDQFLLNIEAFLPAYNITFEYFNRFFSSVWAKFFGVVDEDITTSYFNNLFTARGGRVKINPEKGSRSPAAIALILAILKFELMSEFSAPTAIRKFTDDQDLLLLFAEKLLEHSRFLRKTTVPSLQTTVLLIMLKKFNAKDGDGGDGSNISILMGMAFEMCYALGLHEDIDYIYRDEPPGFKECLKNIWSRLLFYDAKQSCDMGLPLHFSESYFKPQYMKRDDLFVKTALQMRQSRSSMIEPTVVSIKAGVDRLRSFTDENFDPLFVLIAKLQKSRDPQTAIGIAEQIMLLLHLHCLILNGYHIIYLAYEEINSNEKHRYFNLCVKYILAAIITPVELLQRVEIARKASVDPNDIRWAEIAYFTSGIARQAFQSGFFMAVIAKALKTKANLNESIDEVLSFKLSELNDVTTDDDPNYGKSSNLVAVAKALNYIFTQSVSMILFLSTNDLEMDTSSLVAKVNDYGLFLSWLLVSYLNKLIDKHVSTSFKSVAVKIELIYDTFDDDFPNIFSANLYDSKAVPLTLVDVPLRRSEQDQFFEDFFDKYIELDGFLLQE